MKATVIDGPNKIRIIETSIPEIEPDQVLVKVSYCGICRTDVDIFQGFNFAKDNAIRYPVRIGHEWSGIVEEVGEAVFSFNRGDRVVGDGKVTCGFCKQCKQGNWGSCEHIRAIGTVGDYWDGALAEYIAVPERSIYKLPDEISLRQAALFEPAAIALNALTSAKVDENTSVLIVGTGAIGLTAVGLAKAKGVSRIYLAGRTWNKLNIGKEMGADVLINTTEESLVDVILHETNNKKADVIGETSGNCETVQQCFDGIAKMGTILLIGFYPNKLNDVDINHLVLNKNALLGISGTKDCLPKVIEMAKDKHINFYPIITQIIGIDQVENAIVGYVHPDETRVKILTEMGK